MIKINLLPYRDILKKKNVTNHVVAAGATIMLALLLIVVVNIAITTRIGGVEREIVRIETEIASNKKIMEEIERLKAEKELYRMQFQIIEKLKKDKKGPVIILDELATKIPEKIWLLELKQKGNTLESVAAALDNKFVSKFMSDLESSPYFSKVDLITSEMKLAKRGTTRQKMNKFTLTCSITSS
jgi:type IV pilus assembly protein PilN